MKTSNEKNIDINQILLYMVGWDYKFFKKYFFLNFCIIIIWFNTDFIDKR